MNETKTRVCKLPEEKFDFLGYTFGRCYSQKTGRACLGTVPSKKRVIRVCETISAMTGRDQTLLEQEIVVAKLNRTMIGWANYFCLGPVSKAYRAVESHACKRLRQWLCAKHKVLSGTKRFSEANFVVVRVFRDGSSDFSRELDRKLHDFNNQHRISSGKLIVVATMEGDPSMWNCF